MPRAPAGAWASAGALFPLIHPPPFLLLAMAPTTTAAAPPPAPLSASARPRGRSSRAARLTARGLECLEHGPLAEAERCFTQALAIAPGDAPAHVGLGACRLMAGDWAEGFSEMEWRTSVPDGAGRRWRGEPLGGRRIVLVAEQGFGDTLQFVRYAALAAGRGGRVAVACQPGLERLLASAPGVREVVPLGAPLPAADVWAPLMSLPHLLGTTPDAIPATVPYLAPPADTRDEWARRVGPADGRLRVGICWRGNPTFRGDATRSVGLEWFAPVARCPGVRCYSLQAGAAGRELERYGWGASVVDLTPAIADFADTAALVAQLDLVITSDTAVAHLAGALGVPVWLAVRHLPDWRWMLDRHDSPWYPTMRIFRQPRPGDWAACFGEIAGELAALAGGPAAPHRVAVPALWPHDDGRDLAARRRRCAARALGWVARHVGAVLDPALHEWTWERLKSVAELLLVCTLCRRDPELPVEVFLSRLRPLLAGGAFADLVMREPWQCRLSIPTLVLARGCGIEPGDGRAWVDALLASGYVDAVERTAFQDMEIAHYLELGGHPYSGPPLRELFEHTQAGRRGCPFQLGTRDAYGVTHALFYLFRFGAAAPETVDAPLRDELADVLEVLLARYLREGHWDLVGELLMCWALVGGPRCLLVDEAWNALLNAQAGDGSMWGLTFDPAFAGTADEAAAHRWECNAHPTMVAAMACVLA